MPLIDFDDAVTGANLDPRQTHAVFYEDGHFANRAAVAQRCPHAKLYGITVTGAITGHGVFAIDCEAGDASVATALHWVEEQIRLGVKLICVYADEDRWLNQGLLAGVEALERKYGVKVRKWLAHYTGKRALEFPWVDAEQYADPGPVDHNVALANFFGDALPAPSPHYERFDTTRRWVLGKTRTERGQVELYDRLRAKQTPTYHPHRLQLGFVRLVLAWYARRLKQLGHPDLWNRGWRLDQLNERAKGQRVI